MLGDLSCAGCGFRAPATQPSVFSCPARGEGDVDHVLRAESSPPDADLLREVPAHDENPFLRFRSLSTVYQRAISRGISDADYVSIVHQLSAGLAEVDRAPSTTPLLWSDQLETWVKRESEFVSGSHKARHLIATAIEIAVDEKLRAIPQGKEPRWAIASCGNAALAAAIVAKAAGRSLQVFVPTWADETVVTRLRTLGADIQSCERRTTDPSGDPCYFRFREAVNAGALPLSCQGGDNAFAILGGQFLAFELIAQLSQQEPITDLFVQVGGGALASSIAQGFVLARKSGAITTLPRLHAVQTKALHPLERAWQEWRSKRHSPEYAKVHRSEFMRPWEAPEGDGPQSVASGILDDETYDWFAILEYIDGNGGSVITVEEDLLLEANRMAIDLAGVCMTGSAGLAGLLRFREASSPSDPFRPLVLFTGTNR